MKVISASRRTDIPAYYSEWFMNRIRAGSVRWCNDRFGREYTVSLLPEDVGAIVFRSKNYLPLLPHLDELDARGYNVLFHHTITGLPKVFEPNVPDLCIQTKCARIISERYRSDRLLWRCDPFFISDITGAEFYRNRFRELASEMEGLTSRCYVCYTVFYKNVQWCTTRMSSETGIECYDTPRAEQIDLANELAEIAAEHGIKMLSCCSDYLIGGKIGKAHCIDAELLNRLFPAKIGRLAPHPIKEECGCAECTDIGAYDTCMHGCVYCYANTSSEAVHRNYSCHDSNRDMLMPFDKPPAKQNSVRSRNADAKPSTLKLPF